MKLSDRAALVKLDYDAGETPLTRGLMDWRLRRAGFRIAALVKRRSPSGKGWHVVLRVAPRPASPVVVVALQLLLGSDPMREACNLRRAIVLPRMPKWARQHFNVLYELPDGARFRRVPYCGPVGDLWELLPTRRMT